MKAIYSTLATVALLFSMPALASDLAKKGEANVGDNAPKEAKQAPDKDKISFEKKAPEGKSPICFGGG